MGNCISFRFKKKKLSREHPRVSRWLSSCDFSSIPDNDNGVEEAALDTVVYDSVLSGRHLEDDNDGYITALENIDSENASGDAVERTLSSSSAGDQQSMDLYVQPGEGSVYETSDEQCPFEAGECSRTPREGQGDRFGLDDQYEDEDVVEEIAEWRTNYDARPICPLPTPLRKNLVSPGMNIEALVDGKGKVRRSKRVLSYLDKKRSSQGM